tara:strand:+ start:87 stop:1046 length:960 start_codon:yes stop_codon:yes gene_type:complete
MKKIIFYFLVLLLINVIYGEDSYKLGLGSCNNQDYPTTAWSALEQENIDSFFFLGDNVYGDLPSGELDRLINAYRTFSQNIPQWLRETEIFVIWDDHDYGLNDGGSDYRYKTQSQKLFNDFWDIKQDDLRRLRDGIYFSETKIIQNKKILFLGLDTRFFRSQLTKFNNAYVVNNDTEATILGNEQWMWLEDELSKPHDILILASSIQVLATEHRFEKWSNFPHERKRLLSLLENLNSHVIVISGDRHRGGIYQYGDIVEITASSLNRGIFPSYETDKLLLGETHTQNNYGLIEIDKDNLTIFLKDEYKKPLESFILPLK